MNNQKKLYLIIVVLFICTTSFSLSLFARTEPHQLWSSNSAQLIPKGRFETGIFQPLRYGFSKSLEFSTHPLLFFMMPNFNVKWAHSNQGTYLISTHHSIYYPTWLFQVISREGTGGIISPEFEIPHLFAFGNEILVTRPLYAQHLVTAKLGFKFALKSDEYDERTSIDLPLVYHRLNIFYHGYQMNAGIDFNGHIFRRWHYLADVDLFYTPEADSRTEVEHKLMLLWNKSQRFQLSIGYKLVYGEYPFGTQWHLLPVLDCQWGWQR